MDDFIAQFENPNDERNKTVEKGNLPKLTQSDLLDKEHLKTIRKHMENRFGIDDISDYDDEELVTAYVNNQRRFQAGQSVVTLGELAWLNKASDQERQEAGEAYALLIEWKTYSQGREAPSWKD